MNETKEQLLEEENQRLQQRLKDVEWQRLQDRGDLFKRQLEVQYNLINEYQSIIRELKKTIKRHEQYIEVSNNNLFALELTISDLNKQLADKEKEIEEFKKRL